MTIELMGEPGDGLWVTRYWGPGEEYRFVVGADRDSIDLSMSEFVDLAVFFSDVCEELAP